MKQIKIDLGKLLLRIGVGGLMLFHGIAKLMHGFQGIKDLLIAKGLPEFLWIGALLGEVFAPICILLGVMTRFSSVLVAITMVFAMYLVYGTTALSLGKNGIPVAELNLLFFLASLALACIGGGRYALYKKETGIFA
ncbi:MAG TPA: DoxX family protein [Flavobacterium sp.]|nr:DoxX family protein [Flavobacterium sp.]